MRRSSNPKFILGSESAIEGASAVVRGGRMPLVERDGSKDEDIVAYPSRRTLWYMFGFYSEMGLFLSRGVVGCLSTSGMRAEGI